MHRLVVGMVIFFCTRFACNENLLSGISHRRMIHSLPNFRHFILSDPEITLHRRLLKIVSRV